MNNLERLWVGTSDGNVFQVGYKILMKLADEKLIDAPLSVPCRIEVNSAVIQRFYPPRRGIIMQVIQHPFDGLLTVCGFDPGHGRWYYWSCSQPERGSSRSTTVRRGR